jgi:transcriptional regulator with XRE-family HTH domain
MPRSFKSPASTLFGRRLREARNRIGIAQDRLGVLIGLDEGVSSARMSRYETGEHNAPPVIAERIAEALGVPLPYFYCADDGLAKIILCYGQADDAGRARLLALAEALATERR